MTGDGSPGGLDWDSDDDIAPLEAVPGPLFDYSYRHNFPKLLDLRAVAHNFSEGGHGGKLFKRENAGLLGLLCIYSFFAAALISAPSPFLPQELRKAGASPAMVGVVFAAYPITNLLVSPACSMACRRFGRKTVLFGGLVLESVAAVAMGFVPRVVWVYLLLRILQGTGSAGAYTALLAYAAERFPAMLGSVMGLQEAVAGVGYMIGPPLGGLMYAAGSFYMPFLVMGLGLLLGLPLVPLAAPPVSQSRGAEALAGHGSAPPVSMSTLLRLMLSNSSVLNAVACTVVTGIGFGFVMPTLGPHLHSTLGLSENVIGGLLSLCAALYAAAAPLAGMLTDRLGAKPVMVIGTSLLCLAYILLGPSPIFTGGEIDIAPRARWGLLITSLCLIGLGAALAFIPCLPDMERNVKGLGPQSTEMIASLYNGVYCVGEAMGPLVGGVLMGLMPDHFAWATTVVACILLTYISGVAAAWAMQQRRSSASAAARAVGTSDRAVPLLPPGGLLLDGEEGSGSDFEE